MKEGGNLFWYVGFLACCIIAMLYFPGKKNNMDTPQPWEPSTVSDLDEWLENTEGTRGRPIIFVESAYRSNLTIRQACSVESAARWNPDVDILLVMTSTPDADDPLVRMLREEFGANIVYTNPAQVFNGTPLESWYRRGSLSTSDFRIVHLSDAMRLALLWRLGGIYLDLDIVVQRPLASLRNAILTESDDYLCNAVMAFEPRHGFLEDCLLDFSTNYSNETWIANGPELVTRVVHRYCGVNHTEKVKDTDCDMNILPADVGYSLIWQKWEQFFQPEKMREVLDLFHSSLLVHMWNSQSYRLKARVGSYSAIDVLFDKNCPSSVAQAPGGVF